MACAMMPTNLFSIAPAFCTPPDLAWTQLLGIQTPTKLRRRHTFPARLTPPLLLYQSPECCNKKPTTSEIAHAKIPTIEQSVFIRLTPRAPPVDMSFAHDAMEYGATFAVILTIRTVQARMAFCFRTVKEMRPRRRYRREAFVSDRSTFSEQFDSLRDPSFYIANLVIAPGRTPSVEEIMRMGLIGRKKTAGDNILLPPLRPRDANKKCLIIDLDETLVHASFKPVKNPDFVIPVEIDGIVYQVYILKRPYVDEFLEHVGPRFECVLFTASLAKYADPVADLLDKSNVFRARLFREACVFHKGNYVKDLARLGRDLSKVIIMDNSPVSYSFHPENAIAVQTWFGNPNDSELLEVLPLLDRLVEADSVYNVLRKSESPEPRSDRSSS